MVAEGHFRKETRSAIDGGGVPPHTERAIPGPKREHGSVLPRPRRRGPGGHRQFEECALSLPETGAREGLPPSAQELPDTRLNPAPAPDVRRDLEPTIAALLVSARPGNDCAPPGRTGPPYVYGTTELTEVPQLAMPSLVPPQVARVRVNCGGRQFGYWM
jgi:hypothetical protein